MMARSLRVSLFAALAVLALIASARADLAPGSLIDKTTADQVKDVVSPGVMWCIEHGLVLKVAPYRRIEWNPPYRAATEKYSGQVRLAEDGRSIENHVAGLPFPTIDPNDPNVALKIMWNFEYRPFVTDDMDQRNFDSDTGTIGEKSLDIERHYILDHL